MGTTVTTNLGLIKPDTDESIKAALPTFAGWAAQNINNMNKLDSLFRASTGSYSINWAASITNPTLGSGGFTEGKFARIFPRIVFVWFRIYCGTTGFAAGSGNYRISLPTAVDSSILTFDSESPCFGKVNYFDANSNTTCSNFLPTLLVASSLVVFRPSGGGLWTESAPVSLSQDDRLSGYLMYPTSDV